MGHYLIPLQMVILAWMSFYMAECAFIKSPRGGILTTGDRCIDSCDCQRDGHYQSCRSCKVYASCKHGVLKDNIPCARKDGKTTYWNDDLRRCTTWKSGMCNVKVFHEGGESSSSGRSGVSYIRWGRTVCPETARAVYTGFVGGSYYNHKGGGSNYLCLPRDPLWNNYTSRADSYRALIYGAEYEYEASFPIGGTKNALKNHDVPCVLCEAPASISFMLPGRNRCYDGWVTEYSGYLSAEYYGYHRTEYVCLDSQPEHDIGGQANNNGVLFFPTEARCGSLPCPPYVNYRELSCAVCTR